MFSLGRQLSKDAETAASQNTIPCHPHLVRQVRRPEKDESILSGTTSPMTGGRQQGTITSQHVAPPPRPLTAATTTGGGANRTEPKGCPSGCSRARPLCATRWLLPFFFTTQPYDLLHSLALGDRGHVMDIVSVKLPDTKVNRPCLVRRDVVRRAVIIDEICSTLGGIPS